MTGLWQVSGRSNLSYEEAIRLDVHYVENWSITADLMILWRTVKAVVASDGAWYSASASVARDRGRQWRGRDLRAPLLASRPTQVSTCTSSRRRPLGISSARSTGGPRRRTNIARALMLARNRLRRLVADLAPDVSHLHSFFPGLLGRLGPLPTSVVYQPHSWAFAAAPARLRGLVVVVEKGLALRRSDAVVVNCTSERDEACRHGLVVEPHVVGVPLDVERFAVHDRPRPPELRERRSRVRHRLCGAHLHPEGPGRAGACLGARSCPGRRAGPRRSRQQRTTPPGGTVDLRSKRVPRRGAGRCSAVPQPRLGGRPGLSLRRTIRRYGRSPRRRLADGDDRRQRCSRGHRSLGGQGSWWVRPNWGHGPTPDRSSEACT